MKMEKMLILFSSFFMLQSIAGCNTGGGNQNKKNLDLSKINVDPNKDNLTCFLSFDNDYDNLYYVRNGVNTDQSFYIENFRNDVIANTFYENPSPAYRFEHDLGGKSLAFDGYSNFIDLEGFSFNQHSFSINMWVGLRTYELTLPDRSFTPFVEYYDIHHDTGFIFGFTHFGRWGLRFNSTNGWREVVLNDKLALFSWHNLSLTYANEFLCLYKNGVKVHQEMIGPIIFSGAEHGFIGKNTFRQTQPGVFPNNYLSGAVDEVRFYDSEISQDSIAFLYSSYKKDNQIPELSFKAMNFPKDYLNDNKYRTLWHGHPSMNWVSDTNGGFYFNGNYHLFFTKSDYGPTLSGETWGHIVSPDMVHWREVQPAITIEENGYDDLYVYAGSGAVVNGVPYLFYTGMIERGGLIPTISMVRPKDLTDPDLEQWERLPNVRLKLPEGFYRDQYRDPQIHIEGNTAYLVVVSRKTNGNPCILGYSAPLNDIMNWTYRGVMFEVDYSQNKSSGYMWEVPIFLKLTSPSGKVKYLFAQAPMNEVGISNDSIYFLGDFDPISCRFVTNDYNPKRYDYGQDYFACSGGQIYDPIGDRVVVFETLQCVWNLPDVRRYDSGYSAGFNMGRYYSLSDSGDVVVNHIDYSSIYGKKLLEIENSLVSNLEPNYKVGRSYRLNFKMKVGNESRRCGVDILSSKSGSEAACFYYDVNKGRFVLDTMKTGNPNSKETNYMEYRVDKNKLVDIEIFVDQSCIEIYIDNTRAMSCRAYNALTSDYVRFVGSGWEISDLVCNELKGVY